MRLLLHGIILLCSISFSVKGQRICGANNYKQQLLNANSSLNNVFSDVEQQVTTTYKHAGSSAAARDTGSAEIIHIPVVVHVLYTTAAENISDAQIISQIAALNADFRLRNIDRANTPTAFKALAGDARIEFCLARVDGNGRNASGIERKYTSRNFFTTDDAMKLPLKGGIAAWDNKRYLNIWVCNLGSSSVGYATPPGVSADLDGVVIAFNAFGTVGNLRPVFNKGRTATHEIGHWLGLIHLWGDSQCGDDLVTDTPAQESYNYGCQVFPKLSACSPNASGDMFMNFMDFSDDACMNLFTRGQVKRMRALFAQGGLRNSFLNSNACDSITAQAGLLPVTEATPAHPIENAVARIYPNPVSSNAVIECKSATTLSLKKIQIYNSLGGCVFNGQLNREKTTLNLSAFAAGMYIVRVEDGAATFTTKIVKQ